MTRPFTSSLHHLITKISISAHQTISTLKPVRQPQRGVYAAAVGGEGAGFVAVNLAVAVEVVALLHQLVEQVLHAGPDFQVLAYALGHGQVHHVTGQLNHREVLVPVAYEGDARPNEVVLGRKLPLAVGI